MQKLVQQSRSQAFTICHIMKPKRVSPMGPIDKVLLSEIIKDWKDEIEAKGSDATTVDKKNKAWTDIQYVRSSIHRRKVVLRDQASN